LAGDELTIAYSSDLGPLARVGDVARKLEDLEDAIRVGEQWGVIIARSSSLQGLLNLINRRGPETIEGAALRSGLTARDIDAIDEWLHGRYIRWGPAGFPFRDPAALIQAIADYQAADRLGTPVRLLRLNYQNPLVVDLTGSGFLIAGVIYVLRMIRDWSASRRTAEATANRAQAVADEARARANAAWSQADILRWFADEARAGRWHVPPGDLLGIVRSEDLDAMNRLAATEVTLSLPQGLDGDQPGP